MSIQIRIENDRLLIRSLRDQDLEGLTAMRNDSIVYRYEPTFLAELQGSPLEALKTIQSMDLNKDGQCILGIFEKTDQDVLVGLAELYDYKPSGKVISMGCRLLSKYWGLGIASNCTGALLDYIQHNMQVEMITAHVISDNKASSHCLLKNGFEYQLTKTEDWGHERQVMSEVYTFDCYSYD